MSNGKPRRISIFGGLLWIAVGILFLANNLVAGFSAWQLMGQYWPVLLILLGLAKLVDHFITRSTGEAPARLLTGGEIFLLIMLFIVGASVRGYEQGVRSGVLDIPIEEILGSNSYSYTEELRKPYKADTPLYVETSRGDVLLYPEDTTEVRVVAKKIVWAFDESTANDRAQHSPVTLETSGERLEVRAQRQPHGWSEVRIDLEVHLPKKANVTVKTDRGGLTVTGLDGNLSAETRRGDLEIRDVTGNVEADINSADVVVAGARGSVKISGRGGNVEIGDVGGRADVRGVFHGRIQFRNVAGEVSYHSSRTELSIGKLPGRAELASGRLEVFDAPANITLRTTNYDVTMENIAGRVQIQNTNGTVELRLAQPPKEPIEVENRRGDVTLALPGNSAFEIVATSENGEVETDFEGPDLKSSSDERSGRLEGRIGQRGPQIRLKTSYGTAHVRKAT